MAVALDAATMSATHLADDAEKAKAYSFTPSVFQRVACGVVFAACGAVAAMLPVSFAAKAMFFLMAAVATVFSIADIRALVLPWECSLAIALLSIPWVVVAYGTQALLPNAFFALCVYCFISLADAIASRLRDAPSFGAGDKRMIAPVVFAAGIPGAFPGCIAGVCATFVMVALRHVIGIEKFGGLQHRIPFGPSLGVWLVCGTATSVVW